MKRFLITFFAVIAALVFMLAGMGCVGYFMQWKRAKADQLKALAIQEQQYKELTIQAKDYYMTRELDTTGAGIAHNKELLLVHYRQKPWFYSSDERRQINRWAEEVAAFNGRQYEKPAAVGKA